MHLWVTGVLGHLRHSWVGVHLQSPTVDLSVHVDHVFALSFTLSQTQYKNISIFISPLMSLLGASSRVRWSCGLCPVVSVKPLSR